MNMRVLARWLPVLAVLLLLAPDAAARRSRKAKKIKKYDKTEKSVAGGTAWRVKTPKGPVYVWIPKGYRRETAGLVVYIHGYHTNVDGAWKRHNLPQQFRKSRQNAMFIVPEAPRSNDDKVYWPALGDLKKHVSRGGNIRIPDGPTIIIGHSGAYRTMTNWLDYRHLDTLILLDALYGREEEFDKWLHARRRDNRLIVVAADTIETAEPFVRKQRDAVTLDLMPEFYEDFREDERNAKLIYIRSQFEHMDLVTEGKVIPVLLRLTRLGRIKYR